MTEPYFRASGTTEETHKRPRHRWCKCGHLVVTHFAMTTPVAQGGHVVRDIQTGPYMCHHVYCSCQAFNHDTSLW